jgi:hypothetical protein
MALSRERVYARPSIPCGETHKSDAQRVGVQPQIAVAPTIEGTRKGHDEVLEAAVKHLQTRR